MAEPKPCRIDGAGREGGGERYGRFGLGMSAHQGRAHKECLKALPKTRGAVLVHALQELSAGQASHSGSGSWIIVAVERAQWSRSTPPLVHTETAACVVPMGVAKIWDHTSCP